jgi:2-oxoglutarate ferredoxin oxidoreductase subunit delta
MSAKNFEVRVLEQYCKGCGLCVEWCEQRKFYLEKTPNERGVQPAAVDARMDCTGCLKCATICPDAAIEIDVIREHAVEPACR